MAYHYPVVDLHCDLLGCVAHPSVDLNFFSPETNCSLTQLKVGHVRIQAFAIATITQQNAPESADRQLHLYRQLLEENSSLIESYKNFCHKKTKIYGLLALENASGLVEEDAPLEQAFAQLENIQGTENILYISLTWNHENRFGGGNSTKIGLKPDGERFLEYLSGKQIAIDLSHTSDQLAYDILNHIDKKNLNIIPIASHSNYRTVTPLARNLPDELAREIFRSQGVIGLNFIRRFIGDKPHDFIKHLEHALHLGGKNHLCIGADFYGGIDLSPTIFPERSFPTFQEGFSNASCYPKLANLLLQTFETSFVEQLYFSNAQKFIETQIPLYSQIL